MTCQLDKKIPNFLEDLSLVFQSLYDEECDILCRSELAKEVWQERKNGDRQRVWCLIRSYHRKYPDSLTALHTRERS